MKRILYLRGLPHDDVGGIEEKILAMAEYLLGNQIMVPALATNRVHSEFAGRFHRLGLPVYEVPFYQSCLERRTLRPLEAIVKSEGIGILQSHMFRESVAGRWVRARNPSLRHIFRVHTHFEIPFLAGRRYRRWFYYRLESLTARYVDRYVPISNLIKVNLIQHAGIAGERVEVVPNGIEALGACDPPTTSNRPLPAKAIRIARLEKGNQQLLAVDVVNELRKEGIHMELYLVGRDGADAKYAAEVRMLIRKLDLEHLVHLCGYCSHDEVAKIAHDIPVFMLPSLSEGTPTSILEGMSLRKLVIVSDGFGATKELIRHGHNGLLLSPQDKGQWVRQLKEVFTTPSYVWEPIRNAGYDTQRNHYSMETMMNGMMNVYRSLGLWT